MKINFITNLKKLLLLALAISIFGISFNSVAKDKTEVLKFSDVKWTPLNPARGKLGPKAGNLWGNRTGKGPSGFLVKFVDGFSSPPHIHNVTYRGVVISGLVHNDDPSAEEAWMPTGSFWTQAAGEAHITAAKGSNNIAYIEIEKSPYLVLPTNEAFNSIDKSINVEESNIVWLDASNSNWIKQPNNTADEDAPKIAFLWGKPQDNQLSGALVSLPSGFSGKILSKSSTLRGVIIQGQVQYQVKDKTDDTTLEPGSYFSSDEEVVHQISIDEGKDCIIYIRSKDKFVVVKD